MAKSTSKKAKAETVPESQAPAAAKQALFYTRPRMLDAKAHAKATVTATTDFGFARDTNSLPLNAIEFIEASKSYPIVFAANEQALPLVVVGLEQSNYFVDKKGDWRTDAYMPAYVRQYPFIFFEQTDQKTFFLCIDEAAPQVNLSGSEGALPLFEDGKASAISNNALQFCTAFYQHHTITANFAADLVKHKLLAPFQSEATLVSGNKLSLSGFQMIDEKAFNALSDEVFLEFRKKGWLGFIYLALASASNWSKLTKLAEPAK